jgi:hypothetical protein
LKTCANYTTIFVLRRKFGEEWWQFTTAVQQSNEYIPKYIIMLLSK